MKIKAINILLYLFLPIVVIHAQNKDVQIDSLATNFICDSCSNLEVFTQTLVKPYNDKRDRARAIFAWIGTHVRYDYSKAESGDNVVKFVGTSAAELARKQKEYEDETAPNKIFKSRKGICSDFSYLFKKMCQVAEVECVYIPGYAKHLSKRIRGYDHAWNAIKIQDKWSLVDATWSAGYVEGETFRRNYSPGFFMTKPELFILNHLPNDDKWQLLDTPLSKQDFKKQPWLDYGQMLFPIQDAQPLDKPLIQKDNIVQIRLKFEKKPPFIVVLSSNDKVIPHIESEEDGFTVLRFNPIGNDEVMVLVNTARNGRYSGLAKFYVE
jgi:hypothetical protein